MAQSRPRPSGHPIPRQLVHWISFRAYPVSNITHILQWRPQHHLTEHFWCEDQDSVVWSRIWGFFLLSSWDFVRRIPRPSVTSYCLVTSQHIAEGAKSLRTNNYGYSLDLRKKFKFIYYYYILSHDLWNIVPHMWSKNWRQEVSNNKVWTFFSTGAAGQS